MTQIKCLMCHATINPSDSDDVQTYAAGQGWSYTYNIFSKQENKGEYRCPSCTERRIADMQSNMGFRNFPARTGAKSAPAPTPKQTKQEEKLVTPRPFGRAMVDAEIAAIYRQRFGGCPFGIKRASEEAQA